MYPGSIPGEASIIYRRSEKHLGKAKVFSLAARSLRSHFFRANASLHERSGSLGLRAT